MKPQMSVAMPAIGAPPRADPMRALVERIHGRLMATDAFLEAVRVEKKLVAELEEFSLDALPEDVPAITFLAPYGGLVAAVPGGAALCLASARNRWSDRSKMQHHPQTCSGCAAVVPKDLSVRVHHCDRCGLTLDRDVNAARNIEALGRSALRLPATPPVTSEGQRGPHGPR